MRAQSQGEGREVEREKEGPEGVSHSRRPQQYLADAARGTPHFRPLDTQPPGPRGDKRVGGGTPFSSLENGSGRALGIGKTVSDPSTRLEGTEGGMERL
jgi:hypothetical protein